MGRYEHESTNQGEREKVGRRTNRMNGRVGLQTCSSSALDTISNLRLMGGEKKKETEQDRGYRYERC